MKSQWRWNDTFLGTTIQTGPAEEALDWLIEHLMTGWEITLVDYDPDHIPGGMFLIRIKYQDERGRVGYVVHERTL